jgi:hypothetical protein
MVKYEAKKSKGINISGRKEYALQFTTSFVPKYTSQNIHRCLTFSNSFLTVYVITKFVQIWFDYIIFKDFY